MEIGENAVLLLVECLTPSVSFDVFMDNYFSSFCLLAHLGVNNIRATHVLNKNRLCKCTITGDEQLQKRNVGRSILKRLLVCRHPTDPT